MHNAGEMRQYDFSVFYDGPATQYRVAEVTPDFMAENGRVVHVPHAECVGYTPGSFLVHLLKQDHIGVLQSWLACKHRDGAVHPQRILDVEGDYPQHGSILVCGSSGNGRAPRVARAIRIGVVPSRCAAR